MIPRITDAKAHALAALKLRFIQVTLNGPDESLHGAHVGGRSQCHRSHVAFFFKQWGGRNKKKAGRMLEGRTWDEMPVISAAPRATPMGRSLPVVIG